MFFLLIKMFPTELESAGFQNLVDNMLFFHVKILESIFFVLKALKCDRFISSYRLE